MSEFGDLVRLTRELEDENRRLKTALSERIWRKPIRKLHIPNAIARKQAEQSLRGFRDIDSGQVF